MVQYTKMCDEGRINELKKSACLMFSGTPCILNLISLWFVNDLLQSGRIPPIILYYYFIVFTCTTLGLLMTRLGIETSEYLSCLSLRDSTD